MKIGLLLPILILINSFAFAWEPFYQIYQDPNNIFRYVEHSGDTYRFRMNENSPVCTVTMLTIPPYRNYREYFKEYYERNYSSKLKNFIPRNLERHQNDKPLYFSEVGHDKSRGRGLDRNSEVWILDVIDLFLGLENVDIIEKGIACTFEVENSSYRDKLPGERNVYQETPPKVYFAYIPSEITPMQFRYFYKHWKQDFTNGTMTEELLSDLDQCIEIYYYLIGEFR